MQILSSIICDLLNYVKCSDLFSLDYLSGDMSRAGKQRADIPSRGLLLLLWHAIRNIADYS